MANTAELIKEALKSDSHSFLGLIEETRQILIGEKGQIGNLLIEGRLIHMPPSGEIIVIGDIHGDLQSLQHVLADSRFVEKASSGAEIYLVFLGDYGDRGQYSPEVYHVVLNLKRMFPENVVLLQGNHEGPEDLMASPHDLPLFLQRRYRYEGYSIYHKLSQLFRQFYTAVLIEEKCIMLHAGVPSKANGLADVAFAYKKHPAESHLEEILWSDPIDGLGIFPSPRGAGYLFGEDVTDTFLRKTNIRFLIRSHEAPENGYEIRHNGRILTVFSRKGPPYFNQQGAYLSLDGSENFDSAVQIEPFIKKF